MLFKETKLKGAYIIELEPVEDQRGYFARSFCRNEFKLHGISMEVVQCNISYNKKKGTLRGMHFQVPPSEEAKIVSCSKGAIYDVIIDLRPDSPTYCKWLGVELSANRSPLTAHRSLLTAHRSLLTAHPSPLAGSCRMLYVPRGFAHGFLTLEDDTELFYLMSEFYSPGHGRGIRWNDPFFGITWPGEVKVVSDQDRSYPDFTFNKT
ncbi:MAG: dTDP-4-dehydrorhamnose 3,5-epimerase family protein [Thermodesulfobacteriota bacterium]